MTERKSKHDLLKVLLSPFIGEWGYDAVLQCLAEIHADQAIGGRSISVYERKPPKVYRRPSAVEMVERLDAAVAKERHLRALASRFDAKTFIPTASDVRHFLEMRGQDPGPIKQRQDSFKKVLDVLLDMSDDELRLLQSSGNYGGPTELGPLSDAIKATSAAVRSAAVQTHPEPIAANGTAEQRGNPPHGNEARS